MKKLLLIIIFLFTLSNTVKSGEYDYLRLDESYNLYTITIDNLNTKNIFNYLENIKIVRIYPKVNPIYKNSIGNISYKVRGIGLVNDIKLFSTNYLSLIKKNSYDDYNYLYINGIDIEKLEIYIKSSDLYTFLTNNNAHLLS